MHLSVHRTADRPSTTYDGVVSRHSFSFGAHYDPANVGFGMLVCHNEDTLEPRKGYDEHPHRELEIVTWVLEGELHHRDSSGSASVTTPGTVQVLGAGSGVVHAEHAGPGRTRFVQMWVRPDEPGLPPRYLQEEAPLDAADSTGWLTVPGIRSSRAALHATRLFPERPLLLPSAPFVHLFVCRGAISVEGGSVESGEVLSEGDALRVSDCDGLMASGDAELLAWAMQ
ncbi:MAG TPA: pirin family protein [Nocardioidaceae bacterium]|nr:pirin family protein [Nocardioidaceae bacterium]